VIHTSAGSFNVIYSSGARGFAGHDEGHGVARLWKWPFRLPELAFVTKTVTATPRAGRLRWYAPWRAVWPIPGGLVNAVELTNPGKTEFERRYTRRINAARVPVFVSIAPDNPDQAEWMTESLVKEMPRIGIELNLSCPNVSHEGDAVERTCRVFEAVAKVMPERSAIVKLGWSDDFIGICRQLDGAPGLAAFHLINAVPYRDLNASPGPFDMDGAVSGRPITFFARSALSLCRITGFKTPIISGGAVMDAREAKVRFDMGADAVGLGSVVLRYPWRVRGIVRAVANG